ncbi:Gfo/Idh/MocA family protein [Armatimonas rosea]|uniref:Scyllo-inositol 2-dehydrogenase (NADP+) n=1 Tax=Armatimonas rosea TaxID=685828 RepID=A0A7W9W4J9_ARMRO|nr:Gfo/Idh/MocA family oxidoreductase [Armatimonas rosea]MBB6048588.1 scyllo-inositol 2-dehydrogenase (NADP+) [Armatimonas rosea]
MRPFNVAVIGYGFAGRCFHSYLVGLAPGLKLHGIASRDPQTRERIVRDRHCIAYEGLDDVLKDDAVDLVVLASPSAVHCEQAVAALDAGKHVVTDKIMCLNLEECDQMLAAAERNKKLLAVFQNRRWDGDYLTVKHLMQSGELGTVRWMELAWQGFGAWGGWRGAAEMGGGRFFDLGAHLVDQLLTLQNSPAETVYCRLRRDYDASDIDSEALIVVTFANGATGIADLSGMSAISKPRFRVHGSRATFVKYGLDPQEKAMIAGDIDSAVETPESYGTLHDGKSERQITTLPGRWRSFYENVTEHLAGNAPIAVTLESSRAGMQVIDAALKSAATGEVVRL